MRLLFNVLVALISFHAQIERLSESGLFGESFDVKEALSVIDK
ncbi:hypothetical protein JCM19240_5586 [Vibrio maritimus]|uniref:Uncharacterized protein n=1 Tax=Vibrio maritimus TaxID=990268 RepID=A0A090SWL0_9VIBR|nr:hypothetical protein JCM19240_5586 [Vibrio maritimus]